MSKVQAIVLTNALGTELTLTNVGASIISLHIKDATGEAINVVAGLKNAGEYTSIEYQKTNVCLGATVGRYAGRISGGGFSLNHKFYTLENQNGISLHGGSKGFQHQIWEVVESTQRTIAKAVFKLESKEGEHGYPGNLTVYASYTLSETNELTVEYSATTDKKTVLNITNHAYFNLNGHGSVAKQLLQINADQILETDQQLVPTGRFLEVKNSAYDYREARRVAKGEFVGLDTVFVLNKNKPCVLLKSTTTRINMHITTNQKAMVVFTPSSFNKVAVDPPNKIRFPAICFEAQNFPDAPNNPAFPTAVLNPGETYLNRTEFKFVVE